MATRRERVILDLQDNFSSGMAKAAASTAMLDKSLDSLDGELVDVDRHTRQIGSHSGGIEQTGASMRKASADIDTFSGRLGLLATTAATLGPALIPIGAAAVPAVAGLTAGLGAAAGAAGTAMLAFSGFGDAMGAMNAYQLEPTAANLAKMETEFNKLGPAGVEFIRYLDTLSPKLDELQQLAGQGMFPGMEAGIRSMTSLLPQVRDIVSSISVEMGALAADAGKSLANDPDWQNFFDYLQTDAAPTLDAFGRATGNFAAGLANMVAAFAPLSRDFTTGMLDMSRSFREWSAGLSENEGFQEFISYIREQGPAVGDFLGSLTDAMVGLVKAAAPWGSAVLPILTAVADAFASIADSPIGPALATAGAAFLAFNKTMSGTALLMNKMGMTGKGGAPVTGGTMFTAMGEGAKRASSSISGFGRDLRSMSKEYSGVGRAQSTLLSGFSNTTAAAGRVRTSIRNVASTAGRAAGPVAAIGALSSGAAEKMGLTNTATLGLAGSMAGPLGAAVGAGTGLLMDMAAANNEAEAAFRSFDQAMAGGNLQEITTSLANARAEYQSFTKAATGGNVIATAANGFEEIFGTSEVDEQTEKMRKMTAQVQDVGGAISFVASQTKTTRFLPTNLADQTQMLERMQPAMAKLGYTVEDLKNADASQLTKIVQTMRELDSPQAKMQGVADAIADIGSEAITAAEGADQLSAALQGLLTPQQGLVAAQDQWTSSLRHLNEDLAKNKTLVGKSDAAIQNRGAISERVTALQQLMTAQAEAGAGKGKLANTLAAGREQLIKFGTQAGLTRKQMKGFLNQLGLTPKLVETVLKATGAKQAQQEARKLKGIYDDLPKNVQSHIKTEGIPKSIAEANKLADKLDLSAKDRKALIDLTDKASPKAEKVLRKLLGLDKKKANPKVDADTGKADSKLNQTGRKVDQLDGKRANPRADLTDRASAKMDQVGRELRGLDSQSADPKVNAETGQANANIDGVESNLNSLDGKTANTSVTNTITTVMRTVHQTVGRAGSALSGVFGAEGMMLQDGVQTFATGGSAGGSAGDRSNGHMPQITKASTSSGTVRIWAEPETQGETYIPHANDHRRPRAKSLVEQTAAMFGGNVEWYASGGSTSKRGGEAGQAAVEAARAAKEAAQEAAKAAREAAKEGNTKASARAMVAAVKQLAKARSATRRAGRVGNVRQRRAARTNLRAARQARNLAVRMARAAHAVKKLEAASKRLEKQVEKERKQRDAWAERRKGVIDSTKQGLTRDLWSSDQNVFASQYAAGSPQYAMDQLRKQKADANKMVTAVKKLRRMGLDGAALAQIMSSPDPLATAQAFAALPASQVRSYESLYNSATGAVNRASRLAGDVAYGKQLNQANKELRQVNQRLQRVEKAIRDKTKVDDRSRAKHSQQNSRDTSKGVNRAGSRGARNRRYGKK